MSKNNLPNLTQEQELQQSVMYLEQLKEQIATLKEQFEILDLAIREHQMAVETLKDFNTIDKNNELLIPIGADAMVFGKIIDKSKVIINIGAGIAMEETVQNAIDKLASRIENIEKNRNKIDTTINNLQDQAIQLSSAIEEKYKEYQENQALENNLRPPNVS